MGGNPLRDMVGFGNEGLEAKIQVDSHDIFDNSRGDHQMREIGYMPIICEKATKKPPIAG